MEFWGLGRVVCGVGRVLLVRLRLVYSVFINAIKDVFRWGLCGF